MEQSNKKQILITLAVLLAIVVIVGGAVAFGKKKSLSTVSADSSTASVAADTSTTPAASNASTTPAASTANTSSAYKDGTYRATGAFDTPESTDNIQVSITLKNGIITDSSATATANARESRQYDAAFINGYKSYVVGQSISKVYLNRVSGASLTSQGFNNALEQIKTQAQA
ncbi:MAG TPA: FMN-binding protein [Patescibacteria group bacterium]|nr:FMN-binding protein [Candidatus Saccharimonadales bacterium]HSX47037.1 FMN-binding protein [Patescibacteria group bacterium]